MFRDRPFPFILFGIVVIACSAVLQYMDPDSRFYDGGLITAILLTILVQDNRFTKWFGLISLILILISAFYPHTETIPGRVILQHSFSALIAVMTTFLVLYVKKLYKNIESEEKQVNALFRHATEGIILTDDEGRIILSNPAAEQLFGYRHDELLYQPIETLIPQRFHHKHGDYRQQFYRSPSSRRMGQGRELFARRKDQSEFPVEVSLSFYEQEKKFYVIAFVVDITQRKESEKRMLEQRQELERFTDDIRKLNSELEAKVEQRTMILREALNELEKNREELSEALDKEKELNEIKSRFVSMASHEFRTPLSTVLSSAALISRYTNTDDQDKREKHIQRIKDSVRHLNNLLEDFLSLGKLEEGKITVNPVPVDVRNLFQETLDEIQSVLKPGQSVKLIAGNWTFHTDPYLVKNILINLVSNASKFSPEASAITLEAQLNHEALQITVSDTGIGIPSEEQSHLFTTFYRAHNAQNIQGTGLGLHIVKRYVDLLQGTIDLDSEMDKGTNVRVLLPAIQE